MLRLVASCAFLAIALCACASGSPPASDAPSEHPSAAPPVSTLFPLISCEGIDLRAPDGSAVSLDGAWQGTGVDGTTYISQVPHTNCVWFFVCDGGPWADVGVGRIESDFTILAQFWLVPYLESPPWRVSYTPSEAETWLIQFVESDDGEVVQLLRESAVSITLPIRKLDHEPTDRCSSEAPSPAPF